MALKFKCSSCEQDIVVKFIQVGQSTVCESCGRDNIIPESAENIEEHVADELQKEQANSRLFKLDTPTIKKHDSVKTSGFMEHSGKLYEKVGGDRSYWTLKSIARGHRIYGLLCLLASIGCVVLGVYFLVAQERFEEDLYEKYRSYALFTVAFPLFSFGIFMLLIKEIIMLVVNVAEDFSVIAKEASEIRKAIVDKSD